MQNILPVSSQLNLLITHTCKWCRRKPRGACLQSPPWNTGWLLLPVFPAFGCLGPVPFFICFLYLCLGLLVEASFGFLGFRLLKQSIVLSPLVLPQTRISYAHGHCTHVHAHAFTVSDNKHFVPECFQDRGAGLQVASPFHVEFDF